MRYSDQVLRFGLPLVQRVVFVAWPLALPIVPLQTSQRLVVSRRSPSARGSVVTWIGHRARAGRSDSAIAQTRALVPLGVTPTAVTGGGMAISRLKGR